MNTSSHTRSSDILPLYYLSAKDNSYDYVGCTSVSVETFDFIQNALNVGKKLTILLYAPFPPVEYYNNLINYMQLFPDNKELLTEPKIDYEDWHPEELSYNPEKTTAIPETIKQTLDTENCCILQGPPGTGKSYTIAHIVAEYLNNNKTVCVTTMANKGLIELIQQPPLRPFLKEGRISKTNLSADERQIVKGLKPADKKLIIPNGELLCSSNYILSRLFNNNNKNNIPSYDLIVIEEASQAFLTTIVAFKSVAKQCLIVGDPMQLSPIVPNPNKHQYKNWKANIQIEGLKSFALGTDSKSYRITTTFRLTPASVRLTSIFYNNRFTSVRKEYPDFQKINSPFFPKEGGVLYHYTEDHPHGICSETAGNLMEQLIENIETHYPEREIAIISPFNDTVKQLQKFFQTENRTINLTIETIDRIQGMTVDYTILYIPGRNTGFAMEERRFNVVTSRSRSTTLIISDIPLDNMHSISEKVNHFLSQCRVIER